METSLCQRGVAQRALKHLASGGQRKGLSPFTSEFPPQSDISPHGWCGGQRERSRDFRWILVEDSRGSLAKELSFSQSSVIPLARSSSCTLVR